MTDSLWASGRLSTLSNHDLSQSRRKLITWDFYNRLDCLDVSGREYFESHSGTLFIRQMDHFHSHASKTFSIQADIQFQDTFYTGTLYRLDKTWLWKFEKKFWVSKSCQLS